MKVNVAILGAGVGHTSNRSPSQTCDGKSGFAQKILFAGVRFNVIIARMEVAMFSL